MRLSQPYRFAIEVINLTKKYVTVTAVNDLNFAVRKGEIFGFLGPNGAGKTTTLSVLECLLKVDRGEVRVLDMDVSTHSRELKQLIGVQLQSTGLIPDLTVFEQMQIFARLYGFQLSREKLMSKLNCVGLKTKPSALPESLSGGQRQRLSLAIALINNPEIVFLDEPTTGLDPQSRRLLWDIIREMQEQGKTIVLTTHYMEEAEMLCDRVGIIDQGQLVELVPPGILVNRLDGFSSITMSANFPVEYINSLPGIRNCQQNGTKIYLQTEDIAGSLRAILDIAERHLVNIDNLHVKQPNLEDVFLNLTGRALLN